MNSGIISLLTHQLPYQFHGLRIISTIFFVLDLLLFVFFSIAFILRFVLYRGHAYQEITNDQNELMLCGCWPIAFMTLTSLTALICSNAYWGHAFTIVAYVMWWLVTLWALVFLCWIFTTLIRKHDAKDIRLSTMVILPAVSVSTAAVEGGVVAALSYDLDDRLGIPVIIVSFMLVGTGIIFGLMLSTYLFHRLLADGWPPPAMTASIFIFIGPCGQSAAALQQLGAAANKYEFFGRYNRGTFITAGAAEPLEIACILFALLLTGLGIIWLMFSVAAMIERAVHKELEWTPGWNSIIFPTGTLCTAFQLFGIGLDSTAFRVVTCIVLVILVIVFIINLAFTIPRIAAGRLLIVRADPRAKSSDKEK